MDSLAAAPGTGPATSPLPTLRPPRPPARFEKLPTDRAVVLGILNVTPDSFSDGGSYNSLDTAIAHGLRMFYAGADIIDIGGESTRPGAAEVEPATEQERIMPVVEAMVKAGALVSVDTRHAETAAKALDAGAALINDVSGMSVSAEMVALVADRKVPYVLMHRRGDSKTMDSLTKYTDLVPEVIAELKSAREAFYAAGVARNSSSSIRELASPKPPIRTGNYWPNSISLPSWVTESWSVPHVNVSSVRCLPPRAKRPHRKNAMGRRRPPRLSPVSRVPGGSGFTMWWVICTPQRSRPGPGRLKNSAELTPSDSPATTGSNRDQRGQRHWPPRSVRA